MPGFVTVSWDGAEAVSNCLPQVTNWFGVSQPKPFVYTSPAHKPDNTSPAETQLLLSRREMREWSDLNPIIIHPPKFGCS